VKAAVAGFGNTGSWPAKDLAVGDEEALKFLKQVKRKV